DHVRRRWRRIVLGRIDSFGTTAFFNACTELGKELIQREKHSRDNVCPPHFLFMLGAQEIDKEKRVLLGTTIVVSPDVIEINAIGKRSLRDEIDIAPVELRV